MRHLAAVAALSSSLRLIPLTLQVDVDEPIVQQQAGVGVLDGEHVVAKGCGLGQNAVVMLERDAEIFLLVLLTRRRAASRQPGRKRRHAAPTLSGFEERKWGGDNVMDLLSLTSESSDQHLGAGQELVVAGCVR